MVSALLFSIFANLLLLAGPLFMLLVYDQVLGSRSEETLAALFVLVAALFALFGILDFARGRLFARVGSRLHSVFQKRVFVAVLETAARNKKTPESQSALQDLDVIQGFFASPAPGAILDLIWAPLFLLVIFVFHPLLGWVATAGALALVVLAVLNQVLTRKKTHNATSLSVEAANFAKQSEYSVETLWGQGMSDAMADRWMAMQRIAIRHGVGAADWTNAFGSMGKALRLFMQSCILAVGAWLVLGDQITAGAMIAASIVLGRALAPIEQTIGQWPLIQRARSAWRSLATLLDEVRAPAQPMKLPRPKPQLSVARVTVASSQTGQMPVLRDLFFEVLPGEVLGVIGKSGSGKSTLARVLVGLTPCALGVVRLGGASLAHYDSATLGNLIGYLPQEVRMFEGTVGENIARMHPEPDAKKVIEAARKANAHDLILGLPQGYDTPLRSVSAMLSGGQRQRIALARALYDDPVLLVLDEPNSALDADGSMALRRTLDRFKAEGKAAVMMTHRPTEIEVCDKLLVLDGGRIAAVGPREDVLRSMVKNAERLRQADKQMVAM